MRIKASDFEAEFVTSKTDFVTKGDGVTQNEGIT